jgi:outer membrane protein assembly factor BamE (lipoprotein component of BamABCDE complex)
MQRMGSLISCLILMILVGGCASPPSVPSAPASTSQAIPAHAMGTKDVLNEAVTAKIKPGKTDKATLRQLLGEPTWIQNAEGRERWIYHYGVWDAKKATSNFLIITFDDKGMVQEKKPSQSTLIH